MQGLRCSACRCSADELGSARVPRLRLKGVSGSNTIEVRLPDGSSRSLPAGATSLDLAKGIGSRLAKAAVAARNVMDLCV